MKRVAPRLVSMGLVGLLSLGACSSSKSSGGGASPDTTGTTAATTGTTGTSGATVELSAKDFEFVPKELKVPAGEVTVKFTNNGTVPHTFTDEEDRSIDTGPVQPGQSKTLTFTAPTEEKDFICTIHYQTKGMEVKVTPA